MAKTLVSIGIVLLFLCRFLKSIKRKLQVAKSLNFGEAFLDNHVWCFQLASHEYIYWYDLNVSAKLLGTFVFYWEYAQLINTSLTPFWHNLNCVDTNELWQWIKIVSQVDTIQVDSTLFVFLPRLYVFLCYSWRKNYPYFICWRVQKWC